MAAPSRRVFIIIRAPNGDVREVAVGPGSVVVGRDESADVRVEDKKVSRRHAAFKLVDGEPWVEDLGSANGVKLNGKRVERRGRMRPGDVVRVGGYEVTLKEDAPDARGGSRAEGSSVARVEREGSFTAAPARSLGRADSGPGDDELPVPGVDATTIRPPKNARLDERGESPGGDPQVRLPPQEVEDAPVLVALDDPVKDQRFVLHAGENIVGRLEECDIPILDGSVSRQHARVVFARDRISVTDLGSSNGCFLNEVKVEMAELVDGDVVRIGNIRFRLEVPPSVKNVAGSGPGTGARRAKREGLSARRLAMIGVAVSLVAIAVLSYTIYWKVKARGARDGKLPLLFALGGRSDASVPAQDVEPGALDAGAASTPKAPREGPEARIDAAIAQKASPDAGAAAAEVRLDAGLLRAMVERPTSASRDGGERRESRASTSTRAVETSTLAPGGTGVRFVFGPVVTATSPFGRRDERGVPINLPPIDERFDFEGFVAEKLAAAQALEKDEGWPKLRAVVGELLERDPINEEGRRLLRLVVARETAAEAFQRAEKLAARGDVKGAIKAYAQVPDGAPETPRARMRVEELKHKAITDELDKADAEAKEKATILRAHERYRSVLELDPESTRALEGVKKLERELRGQKVSFTAYVPASAKGRPRETKEDVDLAIARRYPADPGLSEVAHLYAQGSMAKALKQLDAVEKKADAAKKDQVKQVRASLKAIQGLYERIRNEISNDPNVAWAKLLELERAEAGVLPPEVKSYLRKELEESLAEAFANAGASLFDREKLEEAFQRWDAGFKLDPTNAKVIAGLKKLEDKAKQLADEAEIAAQRGDRKACEKLKTITHLTRADSEIHKRALDRARQVCS